MNETHKIAKTRQVKDKRAETKAVGGVRKVHKAKRRQHLFYLWAKGTGERVTRWSFHPKISGGIKSLLSRGKLSCTMLQLQYKSGRKPVYIWTEIRRRKGKRTLRSETKKREVERGRLSKKD